MQPGANDVYIIQKPDGSELLVPVVEAFIKDIDIQARKIIIDASMLARGGDTRLKISVLTIFPEMLEPLKHSILGRAAQNGLIQLEIINIRDYSSSKHKNTDDYPFGGGAGMLMSAQPIFDCLDAVCPQGDAYKICLSPRGRMFQFRYSPGIGPEGAFNTPMRTLRRHRPAGYRYYG